MNLNKFLPNVDRASKSATVITNHTSACCPSPIRMGECDRRPGEGMEWNEKAGMRARTYRARVPLSLAKGETAPHFKLFRRNRPCARSFSQLNLFRA